MKWVAVVIGVLVVALFAWVALGKGIKVEVQNVTAAGITDVRVQVKGAEYTIGSLAAGESDTVSVEPTAETDEVRVRWKDAKGKERFARVTAMIDPGNTHGMVTIRLGEGVLHDHEVDLDHGFF